MITMGDEGFMNGGVDGSYPYTTGEGIDFAANLKNCRKLNPLVRIDFIY
jgi:hypothetical protein